MVTGDIALFDSTTAARTRSLHLWPVTGVRASLALLCKQALASLVACVVAITLTLSPASAQTKCNDGIDNDGDGLTDALFELPSTNNLSYTFTPPVDPGPQFSVLIGDIIRAKKLPYTMPGPIKGRAAGILRSESGSWSESGADNPGNVDLETMNAVCRVIGYRDYVSSTCRDTERSGRYPNGKCNFHSTRDNYLWRFSGADFRAEDASPKISRTWITSITCSSLIPACSDGWDNDGDGLIDMKDNGCITPNDHDERPHDPACVTASTNSELAQCGDSIDNDKDGVADRADPGCWRTTTDSNTYDASLNAENRATTECQDGRDNELDSTLDAKDPGCWRDPRNPATYDPTRNNEALAGVGQCFDGKDNDADGVVDSGDPGCWKNSSDPATYDMYAGPESNATTQCQDGKDNDTDKLTDSKDPGCWKDATNPTSYERTRNNEAAAGQGECGDGSDNDNDGLIDRLDPGCWTNPSDPSSYDPNRRLESAATSQCQDGKDNDADSLVDSKDPGCWRVGSDSTTYDRTRNNEAATVAQCQDGIDNDNDNLTDLRDPGCSSATDNDETGEAALLTVGVECVTDNKDGTKTAYFSYNNTSAGDILVTTNSNEGTLNEFVTSGSKTVPPINFKTGTVKGGVAVIFSSTSLTWVVRAPKSALSQVAANDLTPRCAKVVPSAECRGFKNGVLNVRFGYSNPNAFTQEFSTGANNFFSPGIVDRGQPIRFLPGKNSSVFEAPLASADEPLSWSINGSAVSVSSTLPTCDGLCTDAPTSTITGNLDRIAGQLSDTMNRAAELLASSRGSVSRAQTRRNKKDAERSKKKAAQYEARAKSLTIEIPAVVKTCPQAPALCATVNRGATLDALRDLYANQRNSVQRTVARSYFRNGGATKRNDTLVAQAKALEAQGLAELLKLPRVVVECK